MQHYTENDLPLWVSLNSIEDLGAITFIRLLKKFGSVEAIYSASQSDFSSLRIKDSIITAILNGPNLEFAQKEIALATAHSIQIVPLYAPEYPLNLKESPFACPLLYVKGHILPIDQHAVAVVGTRKATDYGRQATEAIVDALTRSSMTVISGLALGIDRIAHRKCIINKHRTIAVLGQGLLDITDQTTLDYIAHICTCGAVVSQFPLMMPGSRNSFPIRNRIISGLSKGCVVIESDIKGGALITARAALDEGKEVMAVPGSIFSSASRGCNALIAEGAHPVYMPEHVIQIISGQLETPEATLFSAPPILPEDSLEVTPLKAKLPQLSETEHLLLNSMPLHKIHIDELSDKSQLPASKLLAILTTLELKSCVASHAGMCFQKVV